MKLLLENWQLYLTEMSFFGYEEDKWERIAKGEEPLGVSDFTQEKIKNGIGKLKNEIDQSTEAGNLLLRALEGEELAPKENDFLKQQMIEILGGTALAALFFVPAGSILVPMVIALAKKFDIELLPSSFRESRLLREIDEDELDHIRRAIDEMNPEDLAFNEMFDGKERVVIDFPTRGSGTELGEFLSIWDEMEYVVDWQKGVAKGVGRIYTDTNPSSIDLLGDQVTLSPTKHYNVQMKIGKWLKKAINYAEKIVEMRENIGAPIVGRKITNALGEEGANKYYKMTDYYKMLTNQGDSAPAYKKDAQKFKKALDYWQGEAGYIKKNSDDTNDTYSIIITREPIDVLRMADFENIQSCHTPPSRGGGSEYYKCAVAEAHGHGAVAYVVNTEDLLLKTDTDNIEEAQNQIQDGEIFDDEKRPGGTYLGITPLSRLRLRQIRHYDTKDPKRWDQGTQLAVPEKRIYGKKIPGFRNRVLDWAREHQETQMASVPRDGEQINLRQIVKFGGSHGDTNISSLISQLFDGDKVVGFVKQNTETEDELDDAILMAGLKDQYADECERIAFEYNEKYNNLEIGFEIGEAGPDLYIDPLCYARIAIGEKNDWNEVPSDKLNYYAIDELNDLGFSYFSGSAETKDRIKFVTRPYMGLRAKINPVGISGLGSQYSTVYSPDQYEELCKGLAVVQQKIPAIKQILTTFYKHNQSMKGGAILELGWNTLNGEYDTYAWQAEAAEGDEHGEFDEVSATAKMTIDTSGIERERVLKVLHSRDFWITLKRLAVSDIRVVSYPNFYHGIEFIDDQKNTAEITATFSVDMETPDEAVGVLKEIIESIPYDTDEFPLDVMAQEAFNSTLELHPPMNEGMNFEREWRRFLRG